MAHILRGKQAGIQGDLSAALDPSFFVVEEVLRYGINSHISALAFDPVQSLIAVGTDETQYGDGRVYVFGQKRVSRILSLPRKASVKKLQFSADKLIVVDSKNDVIVFSLENASRLGLYTPPGQITALVTDPALDYALIGLQNGNIVAYDLDRQSAAPFKIPNFWKEQFPRSRLAAVVTLAFHPRDVGSLLIGYTEGAVIYSFQQNKPLKFFRYEIPPGALGGDMDPTHRKVSRFPRLTQSIWHPTGTFVLTGHEDSSIVIWDPKDGRKLIARSLEACHIDKPVHVMEEPGPLPGTFAVKEPLFKIAWCSKADPDETGILIAGGQPSTVVAKGLKFIDLGHTPNYATSSWQLLAEHFEKPKSLQTLPTPPNTDVIEFCLIPRTSPHYAGSHDPIAIIALLSSGELITLSFPSGHPINPTNQLHIALTYVHPFVSRIDMSFIDRTRWLGMTEKRSHGPLILTGGAEGTYSVRRFANRNVLHTAHVDGTVRIWDAGHGDEIENENVLQVDVARSVGRSNDVEIAKMSMSGSTGELAVGLRTGEAVMFRWAGNPKFGKDVLHESSRGFGLESIKDCADPGLKEGLQPLTLLKRDYGSVTALKMSDIGFVAVGFESGNISIIDLRGPAVIFDAHSRDFAYHHKHGSVRRSNSRSQTKPEWPTSIEFGVMTLENEEYSSILFFVGTNLGQLITCKLLPEVHGGYTVTAMGSNSLEGTVLSITPINAESGAPADATQDLVAGLREGFKTNGVVLVVTQVAAKIFKPPAAKGASKTWDDTFCNSAAVVRYLAHGFALVGLFGDGCARAYSIPGLKAIASANITHLLDVRRFPEAIITPTGDIFGWTGPCEIAMLNVWGNRDKDSRSLDKLFNVDAIIPPRPTISNLQWISGTQHVTPADLALLIGGPDRPPSKRMIEQMRLDEQERRLAARQTSTSSSASAATVRADEGCWAYMQRQVQARTENLSFMGDSMDKLEDNSSGWANDVNKFVGRQKKRAVMGLIGSKLGL